MKCKILDTSQQNVNYMQIPLLRTPTRVHRWNCFWRLSPNPESWQSWCDYFYFIFTKKPQKSSCLF